MNDRAGAAAGFDADVVIAGAGPVGALLALRLGAAGARVRIAERRAAPPARSMAIGVMPPSLRRFAALGLDAELVRAGVRVRRAVVHDARGPLGALDFSSLPPPHDFVLSLPQGRLVATLWRRLAAMPNVVWEPETAVADFHPEADGVAVRLQPLRGAPREARGRFLAICDGARGALRERLGPQPPARRYGPRFTMGDAPDATGWGDTAHLFFTPAGSLESFPLPDGRRRWVALRRPDEDEDADDAATLDAAILRIAGLRARAGGWIETSRFAPERRRSPRFAQGRVALCGDAAHTMSPIGGQGMNTGLGDADRLADALLAALRSGDDPSAALRAYERDRRAAFRRAAARAARGMWLGTRTGRAASALRSLFVRALLRPTALQPRLARYFSMWSLPDAAALRRGNPLPTEAAA